MSGPLEFIARAAALGMMDSDEEADMAMSSHDEDTAFGNEEDDGDDMASPAPLIMPALSAPMPALEALPPATLATSAAAAALGDVEEDDGDAEEREFDEELEAIRRRVDVLDADEDAGSGDDANLEAEPANLAWNPFLSKNKRKQQKEDKAEQNEARYLVKAKQERRKVGTESEMPMLEPLPPTDMAAAVAGSTDAPSIALERPHIRLPGRGGAVTALVSAASAALGPEDRAIADALATGAAPPGTPGNTTEEEVTLRLGSGVVGDTRSHRARVVRYITEERSTAIYVLGSAWGVRRKDLLKDGGTRGRTLEIETRNKQQAYGKLRLSVRIDAADRDARVLVPGARSGGTPPYFLVLDADGLLAQLVVSYPIDHLAAEAGTLTASEARMAEALLECDCQFVRAAHAAEVFKAGAAAGGTGMYADAVVALSGALATLREQVGHAVAKPQMDAHCEILSHGRAAMQAPLSHQLTLALGDYAQTLREQLGASATTEQLMARGQALAQHLLLTAYKLQHVPLMAALADVVDMTMTHATGQAEHTAIRMRQFWEAPSDAMGAAVKYLA